MTSPTSTETYSALEDAGLVQGSGIVSTGGSGQVVTAAQHVAQGKGDGGVVIGQATEAIDLQGGGDNTLVGNESAVVEQDDPGNMRPKFGYDAVAKVRWDKQALRWLFGRRPLANSGAYRASAQPDTAWEDALEVAPGAVAVSLINAPGNPGVLLARISGDMVQWKDGRPCWPVEIDGARWGVPMTYLGK